MAWRNDWTLKLRFLFSGEANFGNIEHETSPKPVLRAGAGKDSKRPNKSHHVNKGKQQRDRRKLREKRRSTGVVHLASTGSGRCPFSVGFNHKHFSFSTLYGFNSFWRKPLIVEWYFFKLQNITWILKHCKRYFN